MTQTATATGSALLERRARRWAPIVAALAAVVTAVLAVALRHSGSTAVDRWVASRTQAWIGSEGARLLLWLSEAALSFGVVALVVAIAAVGRHWRLAVLGAVAPGLTVVLTEYVLKPLVGRHVSVSWLPPSMSASAFGDAFPSGHESGVAAAAVLSVVAVAHLASAPRVRVAVAAVAGVWMLLAAIGLVRNRYHYALDTVGSVTLSLAAVLGTALVIDAVADR